MSLFAGSSKWTQHELDQMRSIVQQEERWRHALQRSLPVQYLEHAVSRADHKLFDHRPVERYALSFVLGGLFIQMMHRH